MIYAVPIQFKGQNALSKRRCFGDCGKIICAGLDLGDDWGTAFVCRIKDCKFEESKAGPIGDLDGEEVYLRKLK